MSRTALGRNLYKLFPSMDLLLFAELKSRNIRRLAVAYVTAGLLLNSLSRFSDQPPNCLWDLGRTKTSAKLIKRINRGRESFFLQIGMRSLDGLDSI
jgi:hypothetical protein